MKNIGIISQVRMGSTRLPGKVLLPAAGVPLLTYHIQRLQQSNLAIILATTMEPVDDVLASYAQANNLPYYRGSETDVLSRYHEAAKHFGLDAVIRVTSDCPLIDGELIGAAARRFMAENNPLVYRSNSIVRSFPRGLDFEIFSFQMLQEAYEQANTAYEREHVTPYIKTNPTAAPRVIFRDEVYKDGDFSHFRITLDTEEDFTVIQALIEQHHAADLTHPALIQLLVAHPEIMALNAHIEQKAG